MKRNWNICSPDETVVDALVKGLNANKLLCQCLANRGQEDTKSAKRFLSPKLADLSPPELIPNLSDAVLRLFEARRKKERIVVFGDYDVDGITSTAILIQSMGELGWNISSYLPDRMDEGYGLTSDGVKNCIDKHSPHLIIAADCGSTSVKVIEDLNRQAIDVIVLDHHQVCDPPPKPYALVNPNISLVEGGELRDLCTAGLAFKLVHGLVKHGRENNEADFEKYDIRLLLDLVALGTIADMVPLTGENRILAFKGLQQLNRTKRPGLIALINTCGIKGSITPYEVGFQLCPRLNAAGRLKKATASLDLIMAADEKSGVDLATGLDKNNQDRQRIEKEITRKVKDQLTSDFDPSNDFVIVAGEPGWNIGVIGIVASKIQREFYRPTFILGGNPDDMRGSGRSIKGFDLCGALDECADHLIRHGGHAMAAGITLKVDNIESFRERLNSVASEMLDDADLVPSLRLDAVCSLGELNLSIVDSLESLQPLGQSLPLVQAAVLNVELFTEIKWMGSEKQHAKLIVTDGDVNTEVVWWNAEGQPQPSGRFDLAVQPSVNLWRGRRSVQLKLLDWRPSS